LSAITAVELQQRIHQAIPLSQAMGYQISEIADTRITVVAPLGPNINIHGTGFAGSLYALGILTAWGLCTYMISRAGLEADLVVAEANIRYKAPVKDDIVCRCEAGPQSARTFIDELAAKRRSRTMLEVLIGDGPAAVIRAEMHASRH
jgi:thioesterase domain-containing protein